MPVQPNIGVLLLRASGTFNGLPLPPMKVRFPSMRSGLLAMGGEAVGTMFTRLVKIYLLLLPKVYPWNGMQALEELSFLPPPSGLTKQSILVPMIINSMLFMRMVVPSGLSMPKIGSIPLLQLGQTAPYM